MDAGGRPYELAIKKGSWKFSCTAFARNHSPAPSAKPLRPLR
jgi:hypothetical protein